MVLGSRLSIRKGRRAARRRRLALARGTTGRLLAGSLFLALGLTVGCGGSSTGSSGSSGSSSGTGTSGITVSVSPKSVSLAAGAAQQFSAAVSNDPNNKGVNWSITQNGTVCTSGCGTISVSTTASGATTTYTAPGSPVSVTLTATSISDPTASASASISVAGGISVLVAPSTASVALGATYQFTASVANDTSNKGVNWQLTQNGSACTPACGQLSATSTASGNPVTYTAPTTAPSSSSVTLTATSVAAPSASSYATISLQGGNSVSVSPAYINLAVNATQTFTATVTGGSGSQAVNWKLTQNGKDCTPGCGSLSGSTTNTNNATVVYTAPSSAMTVTLTATSTANTNQSGSATIVVQPITVSVAPAFSNAYPNQTITYVATVNNDVSEKGVTWSLTENGSNCSPGCGSFSPTQTAGGAQTTYTAPSTVKSPAVLTVVATSVTNTKVTGTATIDLYPPIAVSVSPSSATATINSSNTTFTATVTNDPTDSGVKWVLTQNGKDCSPGCGSVSPTQTGSGSPTTYFAPSSVPSSSKVTLTANSIATANSPASGTATITISSSVTLRKLSGSYALLFNGYDSSGSAVAAAGSFTADGAGKVTGILDSNSAAGVTTAQPITGSYSLNSGNEGTLTIESSNGGPLGTLHFALNEAGTGAQFVELDGSGTRGWGSFQKQTVTAFSPATLHGRFAFRASGAGTANSRVALAGAFQADGHGKILGGTLDMNDAGTVASQLPLAGSYSVSSGGRGTLAITTPGGDFRWAFYVVSPTEAFLVSTGDRSVQPLTSGKTLAQTPSGSGGFSAASLDGTGVVSFAGAAANGIASRVAAGLVTFDGTGGLEFRIERNDAGKTQTLTGSGSYSVARDGRVDMTLPGLGAHLVTYLVKQNDGLLVSTGPGASSGTLAARAAAVFGDASLSGGYVVGTVAAPSRTSSLEWGVVTGAGSGRITGMAGGVSATGARIPLVRFSDTYTVSANGRGRIGGEAAAVYVISPSRAIVIDMTPGQANATIRSLTK